jgi:hypothetical protein
MDASSHAWNNTLEQTKGKSAMTDRQIEQRPMRARPARVIVKFDQQQRKLLDFLRAEGKFGRADGEIIRNIVLDYLKQQQKQQQKRGKR